MSWGRSGVLLAALVLSGCAQPAVQPHPAPQAGRETTIQSIVEAVLADAVQRTGLEREALELLETASVTWPDGSLGCPQPGIIYTMALVPGYRIRIGADGTTLAYHASRNGRWIFCPAVSVRDPATGPVAR